MVGSRGDHDVIGPGRQSAIVVSFAPARAVRVDDLDRGLAAVVDSEGQVERARARGIGSGDRDVARGGDRELVDVNVTHLTKGGVVRVPAQDAHGVQERVVRFVGVDVEPVAVGRGHRAGLIGQLDDVVARRHLDRDVVGLRTSGRVPPRGHQHVVGVVEFEEGLAREVRRLELQLGSSRDVEPVRVHVGGVVEHAGAPAERDGVGGQRGSVGHDGPEGVHQTMAGVLVRPGEGTPIAVRILDIGCGVFDPLADLVRVE